MTKAVDWDVKQQNKQTNKNEREWRMQQHANTYSVLTLGWDQRSKQLFFESSHVAYQITWNGA